MNEFEVKQLMRAFATAFSAGDADGVVACLADDFVWNLPTGEADSQGTVIRGKEPVRAFLRERFAQKDGLVFSDGSHEVIGDLVLQRYRVRGASADGRKIDARGLDVYRVGDGKIRSKDAYWKQVSWPAE